MIQRLLQGRLFYVFFGALIVFLYIRLMGTGFGDPTVLTHTQSSHETLIEGTEPFERVTSPEPATHSDQRLQVMLAVLSVLVIGLNAGGLLVAYRGLRADRIRSLWDFPGNLPFSWSFGELGRIVFLIIALAFLMPFVRVALLIYSPSWTLDPSLWVPLSMLLLDVMLVMSILTFAEGKRRPAWTVFGVSRHTAWRAMKTGLLGYVAIFPWLCVLLGLIVLIAHAVGFEPPLEPIHKLLFEEHRRPVLLLTSVLACVIGPIAEEFFFRGVVYSAIRHRASRLIAMLASGALFSLIHTNVVGFLPILALGSLLAYLYERTGSLIAPMTVHVLHNTLLLSLAMVFRQLAPFG